MKKVLITGMSGLIGGLLRDHLEKLGGYELSALNRRPVDGVECFQADISDFEAIKAAFVGKDVVVHLAAELVTSTSEGEPWDALQRTNITGTYNVYEAARQAGVKRVVFASSGATIRGWDQVPPYDAITSGRYQDVPKNWRKITHEMARPLGLYGATKVWGETLGSHFSDAYGLSILCARVGVVQPDDRPHNIRESTAYLSHRDVADFFYRCI